MTNTSDTTCKPWCTDHQVDPDGDWCNGPFVDFREAPLQVSNGSTDGRPGIFGLECLNSDPLTPDEARDLSEILWRMADIAEGRGGHLRGESVRCWRPGCAFLAEGKSHRIRTDGSVLHVAGAGVAEKSTAEQGASSAWTTGAVAQDDAPWQVYVDVDLPPQWLAAEDAERLAAGLTRAAAFARDVNEMQQTCGGGGS